MYRDPDTGVIGSPPPGVASVEAAPRLQAEVESRAAGLTVEPGGPAGGVKVNLRGQFRAAVQRHADEHGVSGHECVEMGAPAR